MKRRFLALGIGVCLAGLAAGHAWAQTRVTSLTPVPTNTINGQSNSVFSVSLRGGNGLAATGQVAYPQSFPAAATKQVPDKVTTTIEKNLLAPGSTITIQSGTVEELGVDTGVGGGGRTTSNRVAAHPTDPTVADYSCATSRPDFRYNQNKLGFERQNTSSLGQVDMNFWSGLPAGTSRYVPLGEF